MPQRYTQSKTTKHLDQDQAQVRLIPELTLFFSPSPFPSSPSRSWRTSVTRPQLKTRVPHSSARSGLTTRRSWSPGTKAPRNWRTATNTTSAAWVCATACTSTTARPQTRATTVWCVAPTSPMPSWPSQVRPFPVPSTPCPSRAGLATHTDLFQSLVCLDVFSFLSSFPLSLGDESKILPAFVRIYLTQKLWFLILAEQIQFTKCIRSTEADERHSATFECEVSFASATVSWFKDSLQLKESPKYNFLTEGRRHFMTVNNVTQQDEGLFNKLTESDEGPD